MTTAAIRHKLYDYIRVADEKKLHSIYNLLETEIERSYEWWKDKKFISELDKRYDELEKGVEQGLSIDQLQESLRSASPKKK
jgi:hypothetical protein